jgi:internalin A
VIRYIYDFMPKGIITQLIVSMHMWIAGQTCVWKNGVVLERDGTLAEVIEDYHSREIQVRTAGRHKKEFLTLVTYEIEQTHTTFSQLKYKTLIPCNCDQCVTRSDPHFYEFAVLRKFAADGQSTIQCQRSYEMVRVTSLIDDIREDRKG